MSGVHKYPTISFRISPREREEIEAKILASGMSKRDYFVRSCIYNRVCVVGRKELIYQLVEELKIMQTNIREVTEQLEQAEVALSVEGLADMKNNCLDMLKAILSFPFQRVRASLPRQPRRREEGQHGGVAPPGGGGLFPAGPGARGGPHLFRRRRGTARPAGGLFRRPGAHLRLRRGRDLERGCQRCRRLSQRVRHPFSRRIWERFHQDFQRHCSFFQSGSSVGPARSGV